MPVSGTPTTGDDFITVTPTGSFYIDGLGGNDQITIDWSSLTQDIVYNGGYWAEHTDDFSNYVGYVNFESIILKGGSGNDDLRTNNGNDQIFGNDGDDTMYSYLGADTVDGGAGVDRWVVDYSGIHTGVSVTLNLSGAASAVAATGASVANTEVLSIATGNGADVIDTSAFAYDDTITTYGGDDIIRSGKGHDTVDGGGGNDRLVLDWNDAAAAITKTDISYGWRFSDGGAPTRSVNLYNVESFDLTGGAFGDDLWGGSLNDRLIGNAGNDTLHGGRGTDTIDGGTGSDLWISDFQDRVEAINVQINVAANTKAVFRIGGVNQTSVMNVERLDITTGENNDVIIGNAGVYDDRYTTLGGDDQITIGRGRDVVDAGGGTDYVFANWAGVGAAAVSFGSISYGWRYASTAGDELSMYGVERVRFISGSGADDLRGFALNDDLSSGAGNDRIYSDSGLDKVDGGADLDLWNANQGGQMNAVLFDATLSQTAIQGAGAGLNIRNIEQLELTTGAGNDVLSTAGFSLNDTIVTNGGNDKVNAGRGFDSVDMGGGSEDRLVVDYSTATTSVTQSPISYGERIADAAGTMSTNYSGVEAFELTGGSAGDVLRGGSLDDILVGNGGNDILNGGSGKDVITGGTGIDKYIGNYSAELNQVKLTQNAAGNGVLSNTGTTLSSIEQVELRTGSGNDILNFNALSTDQTLWTGAGNDTVYLGKGTREYLDMEGGSADLMIADMSLATSGVNLVSIPYGARYQTANGSYQLDFFGVESVNLTGSAFNDKLYGYGASDVLNGGTGNDMLVGANGADTLTGGLGVDQFRYTDVWNSGIDTITDAASGDFVRLMGVSNLQAVTAGNGSAVTAGQVQVQTVNAITYVRVGVDGTAGADFTVKLQGTYLASSFSVANNATNNFGDIRLTAGRTDPGTLGDDVITGTDGNDELSGGAGNDTIAGLGGNDLLNGEADNDTLRGGAGTDILTGGTGADAFIWDSRFETAIGSARDVVTDFLRTDGDKINISAIDANPVLAGDQAFVLVANFSGAAGQLRFDTAADVLQFDINGDGVSDFEIGLPGVANVIATDFVL